MEQKNQQVDNATYEKQLNDQEQHRREKLAVYREMGLDPFGQRYEVDSTACGLKEQ